ncbi:COR domain-containing protein, partial [Candidatus Halobeggiatoa sp. HSG11]|nr:COR domain-containing protein [Candidatus Halobeggiatoa sp. HSG11]
KIENLIKLLIMGQGFSFFIYVCFRLLIKPIMLFFYTFVRLSAQLPRMGIGWPIRWLEATKAIDNLTEKYISLKQLTDLMQQYGLTENEGDILAIWLHELGEIFYPHDNEDLKHLIILDPQWVTEHINRILTSKQIGNQKGILSNALKQEIWNDLEPEMQQYFSDLMEQFDLSYQALEDKHIHFIPSFLPEDAPDNYEKIWDKKKGVKEIQMIYQLDNDFVFEIITGFIARSHRFTTNTHWCSGALFADDKDSLALVRAFDDEKRIQLTVRGISPHDFFIQLRNNLKYVFQRFPGLKVTLKKPCLGHAGQHCEHEFDYADIEKAEKEGSKTIPCSKKRENVSVYKLIYGIEDKNTTKDTPCPTHFIIKRHKPTLLQKPFIHSMIELHLCCESNIEKHPITTKDSYLFPEKFNWTQSIPVLLSLVNLYLGSIGGISSNKLSKQQIEFAKELLEKFPDENTINQIEQHDLNSFYKLLVNLDHFERWGLKKVETEEGDMLWLCDEHAGE